jgi:hypothetical protein
MRCLPGAAFPFSIPPGMTVSVTPAPAPAEQKKTSAGVVAGAVIGALALVAAIAAAAYLHVRNQQLKADMLAVQDAAGQCIPADSELGATKSGAPSTYSSYSATIPGSVAASYTGGPGDSRAASVVASPEPPAGPVPPATTPAASPPPAAPAAPAVHYRV